MKFEYQYEVGMPKISIEVDDDSMVDEVLDVFCKFLVMTGWAQESVDRAIADMYDDTSVEESFAVKHKRACDYLNAGIKE